MLALLLLAISLSSVATAFPADAGAGITLAIDSILSYDSFSIRARQTTERTCKPGYGLCVGTTYCAPLGTVCCAGK